MRRRKTHGLLAAWAVWALGCGGGGATPASDTVPDLPADAADTQADTSLPPGAIVTYTEDRAPCAEQHPYRRPYFGDLHAHTRLSFDARAYDVLATPAEALDFARGAPLAIAPLDADGHGTRTVRLARPLDFAALTDHGELLGETWLCTTPGAVGHDSQPCRDFRDPDKNGAFQMGMLFAAADPARMEEICGADGAACLAAAEDRWHELVAAAEAATDATPACTFAAFPAYEYTDTRDVSNLHRNVLFRNSDVPAQPVTLFEAPEPVELWEALDEACLQAAGACDVLVLPHNSNLSNGQMFHFGAALAAGAEEAGRLAELRARLEPLVEIFQHKGDSECRSTLSGLGGDPDPLCEFEKLRRDPDDDCGEEPGVGGMRLWGCSHRLDFARNVLKEGLRLEAQLGTNPYALGFIASTDTHNATPGLVSSRSFPGHIGRVDATAVERLGAGNATHDGIINNPGGLTGVWAVERSRDAIWEALRRRETFATSGPRITVRLFAAGELPADVCDDAEELVRLGYERGVPMGGRLWADELPAGGPTLVVDALADAGDELDVGAPLERLQIIKGWIEPGPVASDGSPGSGGSPVVREQVFDLAVHETAGAAGVDPATCEPTGEGWHARCVRWTDPTWDGARPAFYYARVLQAPTCRWSTWQCAELPLAERPEGCSDGTVPLAVQHRAWTSPIWISQRGSRPAKDR